jgi:tetratricopeptide (TPR) repeat protein
MTSKKLAFFLGAGASVPPPSCLPTASDLKTRILTCLSLKASHGLNKKDYKLLDDFPLEFLLQILKDISGESAVVSALEPLKVEFPNLIHYGVAQLVKIGKCDIVITVNFDILFEKALDSLQCKYKTYSTELAPSLKSSHRKDFLRLYKFHGSLDKPSTLFATLDRVGEPLSESRRLILLEVLKKRQVIFIGYRGADPDISPHLIDWLISTPDNFSWCSLNKEGVDLELLYLIPSKNLFLGDAQDFMKSLLSGHIIQELQLPLNEEVSKEVLCRTLWHVGQAGTVLSIASNIQKKDPISKLKYYHKILLAKIRIGKWQETKRIFPKARRLIRLLPSSSKKGMEIIWDFEEGKFLAGLCEVKGLLKLHEIAKRLRKVPQNTETKWYRVATLTLLLEYYPEAWPTNADPWDYLREAEHLAGSHVQLRAVVRRTEGILCSRLGLYDDAIKKLISSLKETEATADNNGKLVLLRELACAYRNKGNYNKALRILYEAKSFNEGLTTLNLIRHAEVYEEIALTLKEQRNEKSSLAMTKKSAKMYRQIGAYKRAERLRLKIQDSQ